MRLSGSAAVVAIAVAAVAAASTVVMQVNGVGITDDELAMARRAVLAAQPNASVDEQAVLVRAVDQVIGHTLLLEAARQSGVKVDPAEVQKRIAAQRARYASPEAYAQALQSSGTTEQELARREEDNLLIVHYTEDKLGPKAVVTPAEVREYYDTHPSEFDHPEQVKVQMILVSVPEVASADVENAAKARIAAAEKRLKNGESFAKVAAEVSDDPSKARGGEIGWVRKGQLLTELDDEVFNLQPGEITGPIRTRYGYHIMGAIDHRGPGRGSFDEVQEALGSMLKGLKVREAIRDEVARRRATARIETLDPAIKAALAQQAGR